MAGKKEEKEENMNIPFLTEPKERPYIVNVIIAVLNWINKYIVHTEPLASLVDGVYWSVLLIVVCPLLAIVVTLPTMITKILLYILVPKRIPHRKPINKEEENEENELCVVITGCDSGFGKQLVLELATNEKNSNYGITVVFAGCLLEESLEQFHTINTFHNNKQQNGTMIVPIKMDVTNTEEVNHAYEVVRSWIEHQQEYTQEQEEEKGDATKMQEENTTTKSKKNKKKRKRFLHALVNNAGIGTKGLIDWHTMDDVVKMTEVNYLSTVRVTKAFLSIFMNQASPNHQHTNCDDDNNDDDGGYRDARIVNMISAASTFSGTMLSVLYESTKHATDCFTTNLAQEMEYFNVKVISLHPGVFETPLYKKMEYQNTMLRQTWTKFYHHTTEQQKNNVLSSSMEDYGTDFYNHLSKRPPPMAWEASIVVNEMVNCILDRNPSTKIVSGIDAKYVLSLIGKLPIWISNPILSRTMGLHDVSPKMMTKTKESATPTKEEEEQQKEKKKVN